MGSWRERLNKKWAVAVLALLASYAALLVPDAPPKAPPAGEKAPFEWNQDAVFSGLEKLFRERRAAGCTGPEADRELSALSAELVDVEKRRPAPGSESWSDLEHDVFDAAARAAACPKLLPRFSGLVVALRIVVKRMSQSFPIESAKTKETLYRLLYGSRIALEQALLQAPADAVPENRVPELSLGTDEPSATPSAMVEGVRLHSGDLLLSRGGAPTSALIARGNDFPGNFSHVALVYVAAEGDAPVAIEAHIERGVAISSVEDYLADKKLRVLVLRPRSDHPMIEKDRTLPARAAKAMFDRVSREHVPYDFSMNFEDPSALFCSEVASAAYAKEKFPLWLGLSHISSPILRSWLAGLGVTHFVTEAPSDLEYDPSLTVVAEWRNRDELFKAYVDDAVIDAWLDHAKKPAPLRYTARALPFYRVLKGMSWLLNRVGVVGPIPEGMSATSAARTARFSSAHEALAEHVIERAKAFESKQGYVAPYWKLIEFAEVGLTERLSP